MNSHRKVHMTVASLGDLKSTIPPVRRLLFAPMFIKKKVTHEPVEYCLALLTYKYGCQYTAIYLSQDHFKSLLHLHVLGARNALQGL